MSAANRVIRPVRLLVVGILLLFVLGGAASSQEDVTRHYLSWTADRAEAVIKSMHKDGRVGGFFDTRILSTNRSYNYKLSATWLTPETMRAGARIAQLNGFLSDEATEQLITDAEAAGETVVLIEIDPREGSGVIPLKWGAFLTSKKDENGEAPVVPGVSTPTLRHVPALAGLLPRNYDYDRFRIVFPLHTPGGEPLFDEATSEAELIVRIYDKEGRVAWRVPRSILTRIAETRPQPEP